MMFLLAQGNSVCGEEVEASLLSEDIDWKIPLTL